MSRVDTTDPDPSVIGNLPTPSFARWAEKMDAGNLVARCEKLRAALG